MSIALGQVAPKSKKKIMREDKMPTVTRNVPVLGQIGTNVTYYSDAVAQFRGIPYATVHQRFRQAKLLDSWPGGQLDASKFG